MTAFDPKRSLADLLIIAVRWRGEQVSQLMGRSRLNRSTIQGCKTALIGFVCLAVAIAAITNLVWAYRYGGVFLARGEGILYLDASPVRFWKSVAAPALGAPIFLFSGLFFLKRIESEMEFWRAGPRTPIHENLSHTSRQ
jgi:hypothetical protein